MLSIHVLKHNNDEPSKTAIEVVKAVVVMKRATSLGGTETLIEHR